MAHAELNTEIRTFVVQSPAGFSELANSAKISNALPQRKPSCLR